MLMNLVRQSTARPALRAPGFVGVTCGIGLAAAVLFVSFPGIDFAVTNPFHVGKQAFLFNFDGPGKDLRRAHAPLVERGLTDSHFDAVAGHLQATLEELGVARDLTDEVMSIAASTRDDVLNR